MLGPKKNYNQRKGNREMRDRQKTDDDNASENGTVPGLHVPIRGYVKVRLYTSNNRYSI